MFEHRGKFYIVDWKTNRAGNDLANFSPEKLRREMWHTFYFMQYLIYTVAWVKYLRQRLGRFEETDYRDRFGGVFYLFLRGLSPEVPGRGVYFDRCYPGYWFLLQGNFGFWGPAISSGSDGSHGGNRNRPAAPGKLLPRHRKRHEHGHQAAVTGNPIRSDLWGLGLSDRHGSIWFPALDLIAGKEEL